MKWSIFFLIIFFIGGMLPPALSQNKLENLGTVINSSMDEKNPVLSPDGNRLYFTRVEHPDNMGGTMDKGDIWVSKKQEDGSWGKPENLGPPLNNEYENNLIGFTNNGNTVYLLSHYLKNNQKPKSRGISKSTKKNGKWSFPEKLNIPYYNNESMHRSASIHAGGEIIILTLQSYQTKGAEDLYVIFKQGPNKWSEPLNMGDINTEYQDMTPFLAPDGKTLYFASNGYEGLGSRDIFKSTRLDDSWKNWSEPENLGPEVNTKGTELSYYLPRVGDFAYLSSTQNSDGYGDINRYRIRPADEEKEVPDSIQTPVTAQADPSPTPVKAAEIKFSGKIKSTQKELPVSAKVRAKAIQKDTMVTTNTGQSGHFELNIPNDSTYQFTVAAVGFDTLTQQFNNPGDSTHYHLNLALNPLDTGTTVRLENILFERGTANLLDGYQSQLDEVVTMMENNPDITIEVAGHTDNRGPAHLNMDLSQQRARKIKQYLVEQGIDPGRIVDKGYGETQPLVPNKSEANRQKNRRVEFKILTR